MFNSGIYLIMCVECIMSPSKQRIIDVAVFVAHFSATVLLGAVAPLASPWLRLWIVVISADF